MAEPELDLKRSFCVGPRFCDLQPLGFGGGGQVYSAVDVECDKSVAIKRVGLTNQKCCKVALREIRILRKLQHDNIVKIHDVLYPSSGGNSNSSGGNSNSNSNSGGGGSEDSGCQWDDPPRAPAVYIVEELLDTDLRQVLAGGALSPDHASLFLYQLLRGVKYLHSANVLHRDLKPGNLLINLEDLVLKIGDFGLARIVDPDYSHKGHLTQNVSTRWYRSPELMVCPADYTESVDMWSAGCVFAEMLTGEPLFPGDHDLDQMLLILERIPIGGADLLEVEDSIPKKMLKNYKGIPRISLADALPGVEPDALHLLQAMLTFNPVDRASAEEALRHPYLKIYSCAADEPRESRPFHVECEVDSLSPVTLRKMIFGESNFRTEVLNRSRRTDPPEPSASHDYRDDYNWKLEMLSFSSRENSGLESEEDEEEGDGEEEMEEEATEEKLDRDKTSGEPDPEVRPLGEEENNEKSESEASEKTDEEGKEQKLLLWEQEMASREAQEKGATESDGESSEKSEAECAKMEKAEEGAEDGGGRLEPTEPAEKQVAESSAKVDKNALLRRNVKSEGEWPRKSETKLEEEEEEEVGDDLSEKAIGDKLQKEKQEETLGEEEEEGEMVDEEKMEEEDDDEALLGTRASQGLGQSVRRKERENKDEQANNKALYNREKTLQQCLTPAKSTGSCCEARTAARGPDPVTEALPVRRPAARDPPLWRDCERPAPSRPLGLDEVLYVDIPRSPSGQSSASRSPPRDADPRSSALQSPRARGSNSPREKSVRPKKQDWFYMHKESSN